MVAFTCEGRTIAVLYEGTEFEVRVAVDRIDLGYIQPWRAEFIRTRDGTTLFDVDRRLLKPAPSVKVMEALVATFGAGVRAGDRAGRKAGRGEVQAEMRKVLGLDEAAGG